MYHLRLCMARSYEGFVSATREKPDVFVEDEAIADKLVSSGYFQFIEKVDMETKGNGNSQETGENTGTGDAGGMTSGYPDREQLEKMKVPDLESLAKQMGIATRNLKKAQIVDAIASGETSADADMDSDAEGEDGDGIDYGEGDD